MAMKPNHTVKRIACLINFVCPAKQF
jgi:hypothetical protein